MRENTYSPLIISTGLNETHKTRFLRQFLEPERDTLELVWRRTQGADTAIWSGPLTHSDRRRRMVHGLDTYDVVETEKDYTMVVSDPYLWFQTVSPAGETKEYSRQLHAALRSGGWSPRPSGKDEYIGQYVLGGLTLRWEIKDSDAHDITAQRHFPLGYTIFEVEMFGGKEKSFEQKGNIWSILNSGIRVRDNRGNPERVEELKKIQSHFPMQVELGCGPSIEAGIPPLHYLHELYHVSQPDQGGSFIFGPEKDKLMKDLVGNPSNFYKRAGVLYSRALTTEPTEFYRLLQELHSREIVVGDIITNNFDGLCDRIGLRERYVRRFEEPSIVPQVEFDSRARSLLVVGAHADRRRVQRQARERGLKVIYVDPECFQEERRYIPYPLESARDGDILINMTAQQFAEQWKKTFG